MQKYSLHKMLAAIVVALLFVTAFVSFRSIVATAAPVMQQVRAKEVTGTIPGGQFAQIWLAVEPETPGAQVTLIAEWDRNNPADQGLNFFILDDQGVRRVGEDSLSTIALGAGSANFVLNGPENVLGASFNAIGTAVYTVVVSNESSQDATFTLRATNAFIIDGSGNVTDPNAPATTADEGTTTEEAGDAETPAASTGVTTTVATTATTTTVAESAPTVAATTAVTTTTATATPAPAVATVSGTARATKLSGSLPEQDAQHFLGLEPEGRDAQVTLRLTFEPQDNSELGRRLNFWVLDSNGFKQFLAGTDPSDVAIAAGNRVFRGVENERVASFRVVGSGAYTVLVYNNATVPGTYELSIEGGVLVDDAGQTNEAQAGGAALSATGTVTTSTTATGTVATATAATGATTTTTTTTTTAESTAARTGEPGGTYTVQSGDTLALIARDVYGDLALYESLCAFNNIANCNVIEVGDVIKLPTQAQITSGAQAAATATPAASTSTTAAATPTPTATPAVSTTESVSATATSTLTANSTVTDTAASDTETADTATTETTANASAATIYATLVDNGNFTTLVKALDQSGLDSVLNGAGELTLFAPTDAAFVALRNRFSLTEAQLLGLPELTDTLRYHVLNGAVLSSSITDGMTATTLQGKDVRFEVDGDTVKINGANIIASDVETANGVIHVIDAVIIPPAN